MLDTLFEHWTFKDNYSQAPLVSSHYYKRLPSKYKFSIDCCNLLKLKEKQD